MRNSYLAKAKRVFKLALDEFSRAKKARNELKAMQAAEKGYLCLLHLMNAVFIDAGVKASQLPNTERGRRYFLVKYADRDTRVMYDRIRHAFHINAFHEGIVNFKDLCEVFEDLEILIKKLEGGEKCSGDHV